MKKTYRSPWGAYAALLQSVLGVLFALIVLAPEASAGERTTFGLLGLILILGAVRAALMRVVQDGQQLMVHGFTSTRAMHFGRAVPRIVDDKILAVWAPSISGDTDEAALTLLSGYGRERRPNRRVAKICAEMNRRGSSTLTEN
jgi:hypothetical protein